MDCRRMTPFHHCKPPTANWKLHTSSVAALVCLGLLALAGRASAQPVQQGPVFKYYV